MNRVRSAFIACTAAGLFALSCAKKSATDQSLVTDIQSKLYADDTTRPAGIKVDAKNGVVTLSGDVPSSDVELEAMKVANGANGVARVDDQMKVNAAAAPAAPVAQTAPAAPPNTAPPASSYPPVPAPAAATAEPRPASEPVASNEDRQRSRPVRPTTLTVPAGSRLQVRMIDGIDSKTNSPGQSFQASLDAPLVAGSRVAVPAGAPVTVILDTVKSAGRIKGNSELTVRATSIRVGGRSYELSTDTYSDVGKARGKQTAIRTGIGAAAGALIGGLAGGGKGAGIGAAAGGGAGIGYQALTHGGQVKIPSETVLTFSLAAPLSVTPPRNGEAR
jgi:hypothetical protein